MSDRDLELTQLRASLTVAELQRKNADTRVKTASNKFAREAAESDLASRTKEVEDLTRQIEALERPE